jgi:hypothetical protein
MPTSSPRKVPLLLCASRVLATVCLSFAYGFGVGFYHWLPFNAIRSVQHALFQYKVPRPDPADHYPETELLGFAFTDELIQDEQVHAPVISLVDIYESNKLLILPVENFYDAYNRLKIIDAAYQPLDHGATKLLKVTYALASRKYDAYAYTMQADHLSQQATLIIPGSGLNQSSAIYKGDRTNYHYGIIEAFGSFDKFVLIKPNEDCLAIHNGKAKLNAQFYINWLLNQGASYSAVYIAHSLAITKYLQETYDKVVVAGLSQGGAAALLNALQSYPTAAIIASGFSIMSEKVDWAGYNQIIIPGLNKRLSMDAIRLIMQRSPTTHFLFTYGKGEEGTYKIEAEQRLSCDYSSSLENVKCEIHNGGHVFPTDIISKFLTANIP